MNNLITKLYADENFPIYLGIVIFILVIAFFIVYFFGKKDQKKIEQTQKLQPIKDDAFKEETPVTPIEVQTPVQTYVEPPVQEIVTPVTPVAPVIETPTADVPVTPVVPENVIQNVAVTPELKPALEIIPDTVSSVTTPVEPVTKPIVPVYEPEITTVSPVEEYNTDVTTVPEDNYSSFNIDDIKFPDEEDVKQTEVINPDDIATIDEVHEIKPEIKEYDPDVTMAIELPRLKPVPIIKEKEESKLNV